MKRKMKSYRLEETTIKKLNALKNYYDTQKPDLGITETDIIERGIRILYAKAKTRGEVPGEERL